MFTATWWGIGLNYGTLNIAGDTKRYAINWGDGSRDAIRTDRDGDGDDFATTAYGHGYASDGVYDVAVTQTAAGLPPVRLRAFMFGRETDAITIGGSRLDDIIVGGSNNDSLRGGDGRDTIAGNDGNDTITGGEGDDFLLGGQGADDINGGNGGDLIGGNEGDDTIVGGAGGDSLYGDDGADVIRGGADNDFINGGAGRDRLWGDAGSDTFAFAPPRVNDVPQASDPDRDVVMDYQQGSDRLDVNAWFPSGFSFIGGSAFSGTGGGEVRAVARGSDTLVVGDVDGNGTGDFSFVVNGGMTLQSSDFGIFAM